MISSSLVLDCHEQVRTDQLSALLGPPRMQKHQFYRSSVARLWSLDKKNKIVKLQHLKTNKISTSNFGSDLGHGRSFSGASFDNINLLMISLWSYYEARASNLLWS